MNWASDGWPGAPAQSRRGDASRLRGPLQCRIKRSPRMPIRMKDIAKDVGVSVMTVSKVIRNHSDIGEQTRNRVLKRIQELGYTPNAAARALATGRSNVMALIVPDLVHPF